MQYHVIEGKHQNPNDYETILQETLKHHGPMDYESADRLAQQLIMKNVDDYYHRAWILDDQQWDQFKTHRNKVRPPLDKR